MWLSCQKVILNFTTGCRSVFSFFYQFVLLLIMNSFIIRTLQKRMIKKISLRADQDDNQNKSKNPERQVYVVLLLVTFSFLILKTPGYLFFIINLIGNFTTSPKVFAGYYLYSNIAQKLHVTNYGINFFLYVISGRKFQLYLRNITTLQGKRSNMSGQSETDVSSISTCVHNNTNPKSI